jgi:hypothetical protein
MMVDPPQGWRYGFPKSYDKSRDGDLGMFLKNGGYPVEDIDFALRYLRMWPENNERIDVV